MAKISKESNSFIKVISLSEPKYRILVFPIVLLTLAIIPVSILENMPDLSICSKFLGDHCYSKGITRGVSSLLKGDFERAISYNPISIAVLMVIVALLISDTLKLYKTANFKYTLHHN